VTFVPVPQDQAVNAQFFSPINVASCCNSGSCGFPLQLCYGKIKPFKEFAQVWINAFQVSGKSPDKAVQYRTDAMMLYKKNPSWEDAKRLNDKTVLQISFI